MGVPLSKSEFPAGDDPLVDVSVTRDCLPFDLTGKVVEIEVKGPSPFTLTSDGAGATITIAAGAGGTAVADFLGKMETVGDYRFRARVVDPGDDDRQLTFDRGTYRVV